MNRSQDSSVNTPHGSSVSSDPRQAELEALQKTANEMDQKYKAAVLDKERTEAEKVACEQLISQKTKETEKLKAECQKLKNEIVQIKRTISENEAKSQAMQKEHEKLAVQAKSKLPPTVFKSEINSLEEQLRLKDEELNSLYIAWQHRNNRFDKVEKQEEAIKRALDKNAENAKKLRSSKSSLENEKKSLELQLCEIKKAVSELKEEIKAESGSTKVAPQIKPTKKKTTEKKQAQELQDIKRATQHFESLIIDSEFKINIYKFATCVLVQFPY